MKIERIVCDLCETEATKQFKLYDLKERATRTGRGKGAPTPFTILDVCESHYGSFISFLQAEKSAGPGSVQS
jgi:hypothetical protein